MLELSHSHSAAELKEKGSFFLGRERGEILSFGVRSELSPHPQSAKPFSLFSNSLSHFLVPRSPRTSFSLSLCDTATTNDATTTP